MVMPHRKDFLQNIHKGILPVYDEIPYSPPCAIYESLASGNSFLLESVKGPEKIARYSFIGFEPCMEFTIKNRTTEIRYNGKEIKFTDKPLFFMKDLLHLYKQTPVEHLPSFQGGLAGIFSYDFVQYLELLPRNAVDDLGLPDAHFLMVDKLIAFDHKERKSWIIVCPGVHDTVCKKKSVQEIDWQEKYDAAE